MKASLTCQSARNANQLVQNDKIASTGRSQKRKALPEDTHQLEKDRAAKPKLLRAERTSNTRTEAEPEPEPEHPHQLAMEPWYDPNAEFDPFGQASDNSDSDDLVQLDQQEGPVGGNQGQVQQVEFKASKICSN